MKRICLFLLFLYAIALQAVDYQPVVYPQQQTQVGIAQASVRDSVFTLSNNLLSASFVCKNGVVKFGGCEALGLMEGSELFYIVLGKDAQMTKQCSDMRLDSISIEDLEGNPSAIRGSEHFAGKSIVANFTYGTEALKVTWRAILRDGSHYLRTTLTFQAIKNIRMHHMVPLLYRVDTSKFPLPEVSGNTRGSLLASARLFAGLETPMGINAVDKQGNITGTWSRDVTLEAGKEWEVGAVVGMMGEGQQRRSFLAYSERERAVPWRPMPVYISWYELNIDRNNDPDYTTNMTISQCANVIKQWKQRFFDKYQVGVKAFVWDDGWDKYGTWTFNKNFPNGFSEADELARQMGSGIGAWLGPVGGYGQSGNYRRKYWTDQGQSMQLSNPQYYQVFWDACKYMIDNYDFRFFKFDGISAQFSSVGPDSGTTGEENAEAIIELERQIRKQLCPDIFFNTTVGTWASPFWFHFTDAVWRQEQDYGTIGNNSIDRENWITYRDRLVYKNFVQNAPLCPINTLMTHGFILSAHGDVSKTMSYQAVLRELRCAFACGSGMVELYNDYSLMNSINSGKLWQDLAECIQWQQDQADVLPDIHWVGGNPWDGQKANVYGWAAWNGQKSVLTLRNGSESRQTFKTTLREALDIPASVTGSIIFTKAFSVQYPLSGLPEGEPIDIDQELSLSLLASSVYVFNGIDSNYDGIESVYDSSHNPKGHLQSEAGEGWTNDDETANGGSPNGKYVFDLSGRSIPQSSFLKTSNMKSIFIRNNTKFLK
ncbi:MAG: hypothetical protein J6Y04_04380 [Bacteroidaceae bacterium]|nr:hypothetical protein [Bacteroidaceae bacterium]